MRGGADAGIAVTNFDGQTTTAVRENRTGRWGLRGEEKISPNLSVLFRLESEVDFGTGRTDEEKGMFARQAWVGLKGNFGLVRIGQTKALFDDLSEQIDPFRNDGIVGDFNKLAWRVGVAESRVSNSITYELPNFSGLELKSQYSMDETPGRVGSAGWSLSAMYENRDLTLVTAIDRPIVATSAKQALAWMAGAAYQFGPVKLSASYNHGDLKNGTATKKADQLDGYTFGVAVDAFGGTAKASYVQMDSDNGNVSKKVRDLKVYGLGYDYPLSRRTTLYAMALLETEGQFVTKTQFKEGNTKGLQAGITHRF